MFLLDGLGALLTAVLLLCVFRNFLKVPDKQMRFVCPLAILAFMFSVYSLSCYLLKIPNWKPFLRIIAAANVVYCFLSGLFLVAFWNNLTLLGRIYLVIEIWIVLALAAIEFRYARK